MNVFSLAWRFLWASPLQTVLHVLMLALGLPRQINSSNNLQAAAPALELSRLLRLLGVGVEVLQGLSVALLAAVLSVWAAYRSDVAPLLH